MTDLVQIALVPASDDDGDDEIREVWKAVYEHRLPDEGISLPLSLNTGLSHLYELAIPMAQLVVPAVAYILATWLKGRAGRKVRFMVGDVRIEANNAEDIAMLVDAANRIQARKPKTLIKDNGPA